MFHQRNLSRRNFIRLSSLAAAATVAGCQPVRREAATQTLTAEPPVTNADEALQRLLEGNQRYVSNGTVGPNQGERRRVELVQGQYPFATILDCADSRVPPELVFDRGLGDLFVIRTAGQVIDSAVLGSIEYGAAELGIPLILVLGHEQCGAVIATIEALEHHAEGEGSIGALVTAITPAVEQVRDQPGDLLQNAIRANVELEVERLRESPILAELSEMGKLKIVGGIYDLESGVVEIMAKEAV
jgi:carbonic anhydrase